MSLFGMFPQGMLNAVAGVDTMAGVQQQQERKEPSGLFGLKGTARDILGTLGDALLTQAGGRAVYAPQRERERTEEALYQFKQTGDIEALAAANPALANDIQQQMARQARDAQEEARAGRKEEREIAAEKRKQLEFDNETRGILGNMLGVVKNEQAYNKLKPVLAGVIERRGLSGYDLPETYDQEALDLLARGTLDLDKNIDNERDADYKERRLGQMESEAQSRNANRENSMRNRDRRTNISATRATTSAAKPKKKTAKDFYE